MTATESEAEAEALGHHQTALEAKTRATTRVGTASWVAEVMVAAGATVAVVAMATAVLDTVGEAVVALVKAVAAMVKVVVGREAKGGMVAYLAGRGGQAATAEGVKAREAVEKVQAAVATATAMVVRATEAVETATGAAFPSIAV